MNYIQNILLNAKPVKDLSCIFVGLVGSVITFLFGGWSKGLSILFFFIVMDYLTGIVTAGVFKKSSKTKKGALSSSAGYKGLWRKVGIVIAITCLHMVDVVLGETIIAGAIEGKDYFMNAGIIGFTGNEFISIIENLGKWGVKFPPIVTKAIEVLNTKASEFKGE